MCILAHSDGHFVFGVQSQSQSQSQCKKQFRQSSAAVIKVARNTNPHSSCELPKPQPNVGKTAAVTWRFENELIHVMLQQWRITDSEHMRANFVR